MEHQSTPDKWLPVRLAEYTIQLMIQHINQGHKTLPIIVNEIIYAGTKSPYNEPIDIFDLFENPALAREIMQQPPKLTDLTIKTQEELLQEGRAGLFEVLMKQGIQRDEISWETWIKDNITVFHSIISETFGLESISYILATENVDDYEKILNFIKNIAPDKEELIMTAALQIEQKGIEKGIEKGKAETKFETARNMLKFGISKEDIVKIIGLTREEIDKNCT